MKNFDQLIEEIRDDLKQLSYKYDKIVRDDLSENNMKELNHRADELRKTSKVCTEKFAAEILHFATATE